MANLPYFFLLLKKNIGLWTLIATGSFSKIDTAHIEYTRMSPYAMTLKNYSLSKNDGFKEIWIMSTSWETSINFTTSNSKYLDSLKYYFGTSSISGSMEGGYTLNDSTVRNSTDMLGPMDIGLNRKVSIFLGRSGEHEYKITLMLHAKDYQERADKWMDSIRRADSAVNGLRGQPAPYLQRLTDSALHLGFGTETRLTDTERKQLNVRQIEILNTAIKADSTYLEAYEMKFGTEQELKRYDSLIITGRRILKLGPGLMPKEEVMLRIGESYELTGHIDSAKMYYQRALLLYDREIIEMGKNGIDIKYEMSKKALVLILLNREEEGRAILKKLSETPMMNKYEKQMYHDYLVTPRDKFLKEMKP